jgi:hypothetical protein
MKKEDALKRIPAEGFIKLGSSQQKNLDPSRRAALIRKGNELFNNGNIQTSKRIFLTTGYSDGIERIGDYYKDQGDILEALRMYWIAPAPVKKQQLIEQCAAVLQHWINQEG